MNAHPFLSVVARPSQGPVVLRDATGIALYAARDYAVGEVVFEFRNVSWRIDRDQFTVEHPSGAHIFHPLLAKTAHSCAPNGSLDVRGRRLVALRPIAPGDCITFDYAMTEKRISHPFTCLCGSANCRGRIE